MITARKYQRNSITIKRTRTRKITLISKTRIKIGKIKITKAKVNKNRK